MFIAEFEESAGWGLMNIDGEVLLAPQFDEVHNDWENGYIKASKNGIICIISYRGKIIWKDQNHKRGLSFNINNLMRYEAYTGTAVKLSVKSAVMKMAKKTRGDLVLLFGDKTVYKDNYEGINLYLVNKSKKTKVTLDTQDRRLYLIIEAQTA